MPDNNFELVRLQFEDVAPPVVKEKKGKGYMTYGVQNDYPNYLLGLFESSAKHGAIVQGKADYTIGNGFAFVADGDKTPETKGTVIETANEKGESLDDVALKAATDIELFGGAYLEIIFNAQGRVNELYHVDFMKVRPSLDLQTFYFSENWHNEAGKGILVENSKPDIKEIPAFNPASPKKKQILFIREYTPGMKTFPRPGYKAALTYIQVDVAISEFHLNGISNGMFSSKMINLNNGIPSDPDKKEIELKFNKKFAGAKNAGKIMLSFNKSGADAPTVQDLSGSELDKHFDLLNKTVEQHLFSGHRVTSPSLFGIKSDSLFGSRDELRDAFELMQSTYINRKRQLVEKHINAVYKLNKLDEMYLQRSEPISIALSEGTIAGILTEDEKREMIGRKPKTPEQKAEAQPAAPARFASDLDDERDILAFADFGKKKDQFQIIDSKKVLFEDLEQMKREHFAAVQVLTENQQKVIQILTDDPKAPAEAIAKALGIPADRAKAILKGMERDGLIKVTTTKEDNERTTTRTPTAEAGDIIKKGGGEKTSIRVMYSYEGPKDSRNRPFCAKLLDLDKLFSRQDIESISSKLGYSVWDRRGGWYRPPGSAEARPYCRHSWAANTVIEKTQN